MKNSTFYFFGFCFLMLCALGCNKKGAKTVYQNSDVEENSTLEVHLMRTPGVFVQNSRVRIRGIENSLISNSEPLFEVNGQMIPGGYAAAKDMFSPMDIKGIKVLKNPDELAIYGSRGLNGVIKIMLKNSK